MAPANGNDFEDQPQAEESPPYQGGFISLSGQLGTALVTGQIPLPVLASIMIQPKSPPELKLAAMAVVCGFVGHYINHHVDHSVSH